MSAARISILLIVALVAGLLGEPARAWQWVAPDRGQMTCAGDEGSCACCGGGVDEEGKSCPPQECPCGSLPQRGGGFTAVVLGLNTPAGGQIGARARVKKVERWRSALPGPLAGLDVPVVGSVGVVSGAAGRELLAMVCVWRL